MRNNIETFLDKMDKILTNDLKEKIVQSVSFEKNFMIIKKQWILKKKLQRDLNIILNTVYNDGQIIIYRNFATGKLMLHNNFDNHSTISIYGDNYINEDDTNTIVNSNDIGFPIHTIDDERRKINLCILYK